MAFSEVFKVNENITEICLRDKIGDEGVKALSEALEVKKTIKAIDLSDNQIGDEGVKALSEALKVNKTIKLIDLGCNRITDVGVEELSSALRFNSTVSVLKSVSDGQP
eukprot:GHVN01022386.1.p1 GENE.GHVN01022386.1~~GHVN01022386.1.p1  ORF type:complete len:108 (+),score=33.55 GHVN01022386.1:210-533(+)